MTSATTRLEARDGALQAMEQRFQDASAHVDGLVAELSRALAELPDPDSVERAFAARIEEVADRTASLTDHLARVETSLLEQVRTSTSSSVQLEERIREELSAARSHFEEGDGRLSSLVAQQKQLLAELSGRTAALEDAEGDATRELDVRVSDMSSALTELAGRLETSATTVTSTAARVSGTEQEVAALREYVENAGTRLSSLLAEQKQWLAELGDRTASLEQADGGEAMSILDERISATGDRIDDLSRRLDPLIAQASDELGGRIDELAAKLRTSDDDRAENASEIARVAAILEVERASLRTKVDTLAVAFEKAPDAPEAEELERRVAGLTTRVEALDGERASFQAQFEAIAKALASIPQHSSVEQRLDELSRRLGDVEQRGAAVASKVSHASALLPTALRSLEARLDEVSAGPRKGVQEPDVPAEIAPPDDEPEAAEPVETVHRATAAVVPLRISDP